MKKILISAAVFASMTSQAFSQVFRITNDPSKAFYNLYVTDDSTKAQVIGYQVFKEEDFEYTGLIYFTEEVNYPVRVYFTKDSTQADFLIYWTTDKSQARWIWDKIDLPIDVDTNEYPLPEEH